MCFIAPLVSHTWGMNSSQSWGAESNILGINTIVLGINMSSLLRWPKWDGTEIILLTARIRFVVSRKDEFLLRLPPCYGRNEVESGCESSCRGWGSSLMCMCGRLGTSPALRTWGIITSISSTHWDCLGSLSRRNGFAAVRSQERQDEVKYL